MFCCGQVHDGSRPPALEDRPDDLVEVLVLRQAGDSAGLLECLHLAEVRRCGQCDDVRAGAARDDSPCGLHAVQPREPVVHHDDVGLVLDAGGHGECPLGDRRDDLDVVAQPEEQLERLAEDLVVLDEDDADRVVGHSAESRSG